MSALAAMHGLRTLRAPSSSVGAVTRLRALRTSPNAQVGANVQLSEATYLEILLGGAAAMAGGAFVGYAVTRHKPEWRLPAELVGAFGGAVAFKMIVSPSVEVP